jgi:DNA-binding transcriptional ArsR family regulator
MGLSKSEEFSVKDNRVAAVARVLAHPARVAILKLLIKKQGCVCGDIVNELPLSQSTVSQHLKELKAAGFIQGEIEGTKVCYCINPENLDAAATLMSEFFAHASKSPKCC